jgi:hypothetical protein
MTRIRNLKKLISSNRFLHNSTLLKGKAEELRDVEKDTLKSHFQSGDGYTAMSKIGDAFNS